MSSTHRLGTNLLRLVAPSSSGRREQRSLDDLRSLGGWLDNLQPRAREVPEVARGWSRWRGDVRKLAEKALDSCLTVLNRRTHGPGE